MATPEEIDALEQQVIEDSEDGIVNMNVDGASVSKERLNDRLDAISRLRGSEQAGRGRAPLAVHPFTFPPPG